MSSIEPIVEDTFNQQLKDYGLTVAFKQTPLNERIDEALKLGESKTGGNGGNFPDAKLLITNKHKQSYPVMIEYKGAYGKLIKTTEAGFVDNYHPTGNRLKKSNINGYAVNGAVHYARAVLDRCPEYHQVIAIGANGYYNNFDDLVLESQTYIVSRDNLGYELLVKTTPDLSHLSPKHFDDFCEEIKTKSLTDDQAQHIEQEAEYALESQLTELNELLHAREINTSSRVEFVSGLIMASLGVYDSDEVEIVPPLKSEELTGGPFGTARYDGTIVRNRIEEFLTENGLPKEKRGIILNRMERVFVHSSLSKKQPGQSMSKTKEAYLFINEHLHKYYNSDIRLDFTGKLFQVMNAWVDVPDGADNDVVLTPRYVTDLMVGLADINRDSYVWDYALGSGGFLVSAMKAMIKDIDSVDMSNNQREEKLHSIFNYQLLGIEKLDDMYMLAILNMILMGDGGANILKQDSLTFDGKYEFGDKEGEDFPATAFLLNPPYSAPGKGLIFVQHALSKMTNGGKASVLIQENAGAGQGGDYAKDLLKNNTLLSSIHMADIFKGKAGVQTAIYTFRVGQPHKEEDLVRFLDMTNDGYTRQNRKKSDAKVNLKDTDNAKERYAEALSLMKHGGYRNGQFRGQYFTSEEYIEDTISLNGNDWTFAQHKKVDTMPKEEDFLETIGQYLKFQVGLILENRKLVDE